MKRCYDYPHFTNKEPGRHCHLRCHAVTQVRGLRFQPGLSACKAPALYYSCKSRLIGNGPGRLLLLSLHPILAGVQPPKSRPALPSVLWTSAALPHLPDELAFQVGLTRVLLTCPSGCWAWHCWPPQQLGKFLHLPTCHVLCVEVPG